jgi:hypothetical protein
VLKKYLSILLVLLAYSVVLVHNCLPHHHHIAAESHSQETDNDHHDDDDDEHGLLNHAFAHFQHDQGAEMTKMSLERNDINKQPDFVKKFIPFITTFLLKVDYEKRPVFLPPRHSLFLYSHYSSTADPRRGPPAFTA